MKQVAKNVMPPLLSSHPSNSRSDDQMKNGGHKQSVKSAKKVYLTTIRYKAISILRIFNYILNCLRKLDRIIIPNFGYSTCNLTK